jgi:glycosyltransferase involved in cell wall biosynthesis
MNADAGVTLDKDTNINYRFSLPNKIFDYIKSGIPVISSDLVELKKIIETYQVGIIVKEVKPETIAKAVEELFNNNSKYDQLKGNTRIAAEKLNWDEEKMVLYSLMNEI